MKTIRQVGLMGYGAYVPMYRLEASEFNRMWGGFGAPVEEKTVVAMDEDTITIAVEAAKQAVYRAKITPSEIGAVFVGTESKPYAVKPCGTIVAEAFGAVGLTATKKSEVAGVVEQMLAEKGCCVVDFQVAREENVWPMVAAGKGLHEMSGLPTETVERL